MYYRRLTNAIAWVKPDPPPNALHTAFTHAHETLLWARKGNRSRHTFNYELINSRDPKAQLSSVWRIPSVPRREKRYGYHPTQKPLRLVRRALLASSREGDLGFDPFCGSGTSGVAAKELDQSSLESPQTGVFGTRFEAKVSAKGVFQHAGTSLQHHLCKTTR